MSLVDVLTETKENLESLVTYSNEITGQSDTDISGCIASLVSGFGQGGSGLEKVYSIEKEFTIAETYITTGYVYPCNLNPITDEITNIYNGSPCIVVMEIVNDTGDLKYLCTKFIGLGTSSLNSFLNNENGTISNSQKYFLDLRNAYGTFFRLSVSKNTQLYQGEYTVNLDIYKL